jgi:hypothetical protein
LNTFGVTAASSKPPHKKQSNRWPVGTNQREAVKLDIALHKQPVGLSCLDCTFRLRTRHHITCKRLDTYTVPFKG